MSFGIHRVWKDIFIERLGCSHGTKLLDMAGGTGDIAFRYLKYLENIPRNSINEKISHVTISDINQHMLDVGKIRAEKLGLNSLNTEIDWVCADAEKLPFDDNTFTAYTIAFGIRNCTHVDKVISEAYRVLKPGGRFMCLEFSHLNNNTLQWFGFFFFNWNKILNNLFYFQDLRSVLISGNSTNGTNSCWTMAALSVFS